MNAVRICAVCRGYGLIFGTGWPSHCSWCRGRGWIEVIR